MSSAFTPEVNDPVLRLHAEDVLVSKRRIAGETVRVSTVTRERERTIDETLSHERVEIERVPIGRPVEAVPPVREEGDTTIMPVVEEILVVERRLILREEIRIRRVRVSEHHRETVTIRDQEAVVTRLGAEAARDEHPAPEAKSTQPVREYRK